MNAFCASLMSTRGGYGLTVLRVVIGLTFMAHGAQKLFGWFGGGGLAGVGQWMKCSRVPAPAAEAGAQG